MEISYIIPCYNAGSVLSEAVTSLRAQKGDFTLGEIIVVNDRSDDPTTRRLLHDLSREPDIKVLSNEEPRGAAGARNTGIRRARGEWMPAAEAAARALRHAPGIGEAWRPPCGPRRPIASGPRGNP